VTLAGSATRTWKSSGATRISAALWARVRGRRRRFPDSSQIGARVVGEINAGCGDCSLCRSGDSRHCPQRTVLGIVNRDGAFAEYLSLPPLNLFVVPDRIPDRAAVFVEPLAAACEILEQVEVTPSHGSLSWAMEARSTDRASPRHHGMPSHTRGKHPDKLKLATSAGIETALAHAGISGGADVVVEASGSPAGSGRRWRWCAPGARLS